MEIESGTYRWKKTTTVSRATFMCSLEFVGQPLLDIRSLKIARSPTQNISLEDKTINNLVNSNWESGDE